MLWLSIKFKEICWIYVCVISSLNVNICRETLFLIDIYIISLFVLMSFDNYIYLILKKVDFYLSIVKICEVAVLFRFYCVMCWTGTFVIFLLEIYDCVVILWCQSVCLMYYWCSKGIINEIGYKPFFFLMKYCHQGLLLSASGCHTSLCGLYLNFAILFEI